MTNVLKVLGQVAPAAATPGTLFTMPGSTQGTVNNIAVCNRGAATTFRVWIGVGGAGLDVKQYLYYDTALPANDTLCSFPLTLAAGDVIYVQSLSGNVSFSAFGVEVS